MLDGKKMAKKRMFSKQIVQTDAFMDMPQSSQLLYFHMAMEADDDGFISSPKKVMKMVGSNEDDYKVLLSKRFILPFESGICVIKHWWIHNTLYKDRYHITTYQEELKTLQIKDNGAYTDKMLTETTQNVNTMLTQPKLNKPKLKKDNAPKTAQGEFILKEYLKRMENDKRRHVNVIGHYFEEKGLKFNNEAEAQSAIRRHLRPAIEVAKFTDNDIVRATDQSKKEYGEKFTIETIWKVLTR